MQRQDRPITEVAIYSDKRSLVTNGVFKDLRVFSPRLACFACARDIMTFVS